MQTCSAELLQLAHFQWGLDTPMDRAGLRQLICAWGACSQSHLMEFVLLNHAYAIIVMLENISVIPLPFKPTRFNFIHPYIYTAYLLLDSKYSSG